VISDENFAYLQGSETTYGGFNEKLNFRWYPIPEREHKRRGYDNSLAARFVLFKSSIKSSYDTIYFIYKYFFNTNENAISI